MHIVHEANLMQGLAGLSAGGIDYQVYADSAYMVRGDNAPLPLEGDR